MGQYFVAFRGTQASGAFEGIITWTGFSSKEAFDEWQKSDGGVESLKTNAVLEEGITPERAVELVRSTPAECRIAFAVHEATDPKTGKLNKDLMRHAAAKAAFAIADSRNR